MPDTPSASGVVPSFVRMTDLAHASPIAHPPTVAAVSFSDYQLAAIKTARYPDVGSNAVYPALKLAGEVGELCEKLGKIMRDRPDVAWRGGRHPDLSHEDELRTALLKELGDVLWYVSALAFEMDASLEDVARMNLEKLASRQARGTLHGEGDNR